MDLFENVVPIRRPGIIASNLVKIEKGFVVARCDLQIPAWHLMLKSCLWMRKDGREWISLPSQSFTNQAGKRIYTPLVEFTDRKASDRFQAAALVAVKQLDIPAAAVS